MTLPTTAWAEAAAEDPVYRQIVRDARVATGARIVLLTSFDAKTGTVRVATWSGLQASAIQRAVASVRTVLPDFDPAAISVRADANRAIAKLYLQGAPVVAALSDVAEGAIDDRAIRIIGASAGVRCVSAFPIAAHGAVRGALSFLTTLPMTNPRQRVAKMFVRIASASIEHGFLLARLRSQVEELQASRRLLSTTDERLRREIAELLHGRVQTHLVVAWHRLGQCQTLIETDPTQAKGLLAEVRAEIDSIREHDIRQASHLLHPSIIQVGLVPAVRSLGTRFRERFTVEVRTDALLDELDNPMDNRIPEALRLVAYRVVEAALTNVHRHADAAATRIALSVTEDGRLSITVHDDGHGFDARAVPHGLGLRSIAVQVRQVGGEWGVTSEPGQGACLWARIPLTPLDHGDSTYFRPGPTKPA